MLCSVLLVTAFALALGAPTRDLEVSLKPVSSSVSSIDDIIISAIVSNPTNKDIRLLAVNNILDSSLTQSFVVSKDDNEVKFTGIKAIFDMSAEGAYKVIPAGSSVAVNHTKLAPLYDFQSGGTGMFKFVPRPLYVAGTGVSMVNMPDVTIEVTDDVLRRQFGDVQRSTPSCANQVQLQFITRTLAEALELARTAADDIASRPTSDEFQKYFRTNAPATVRGLFNKIADDADTRVVSCVDQWQQCNLPTLPIAYTALFVDPSTGDIIGSDIFTCPRFFSIRPTPTICQFGFDATTSSDGGIILHELSHANSNTQDLGYGCSIAERLNPDSQLNNADNYRCMGLALFARNNCTNI